MKACLLLSTVVALSIAAPPAPAPAISRPAARLILLPAHLESQPPIETTPTPTSQPNTTTQEQQSGRLLDSGEYYVLLADGRLQMVKYTTAALAEDSDKDDSKAQQLNQPEPFAQFQIEYFQFPQAFVPQSADKVQEQKSAQTKTEEKDAADKEEVSGFEANVQYREVKPISAPIYAYNPAPLVRIV